MYVNTPQVDFVIGILIPVCLSIPAFLAARKLSREKSTIVYEISGYILEAKNLTKFFLVGFLPIGIFALILSFFVWFLLNFQIASDAYLWLVLAMFIPSTYLIVLVNGILKKQCPMICVISR